MREKLGSAKREAVRMDGCSSDLSSALDQQEAAGVRSSLEEEQHQSLTFKPERQ